MLCYLHDLLHHSLISVINSGGLFSVPTQIVLCEQDTKLTFQYKASGYTQTV